MRGRKPLSPGDRSPRCPAPPTDCSESIPPLVSESSGHRSSWPSLPGNRSTIRPPRQMQSARPVRRYLPPLPGRGTCPISWHHPNGPGDWPRIPPATGPDRSDWPAWNRSPRACTSPTGPSPGPARQAVARRDRPGHQRPDDPQILDQGGPRAASHSVLADLSPGCPSSRNGPRSSGAMPTPGVSPAGLLGGLCR